MRNLFILAILCVFLTVAKSQSVSKAVKPEVIKPVVDSEISSLVKQVSADSIKSYIQKLVTFKTRHSMSDTVSSTTGIGAARRWVVYKFKQFAKRNHADMKVELDAYRLEPGPRQARIARPVTMKNVLGTLNGTDPNDKRIILISGHLDSRNTDVMDSVGVAPGANDDASGVAVVMELARVMSQKKYPCTIIFMAVQGEEQGLVGARYMANKMKSNGQNLVAMFNNDIVGNSVASETGDKNDKTIRIFSEMIPALENDDQTAARTSLKAENDSPSRQLARYIKEVSEPYVKGFTVTLNARPDRFLRGGDHTPFNQLGFTAVRFTEFNENFTHQHQNVRLENNIQYGDLPEFVDYSYAANVARINLASMASIAKAPATPQSVKMKINLDNMTYLTWEAPALGPKPKGYYILVRETFQPTWEKKIFVNGTSVEIPMSKDNYFFAIQSVGANGHLSQIVMPVPTRN
jgi:hypothetical protein